METIDEMLALAWLIVIIVVPIGFIMWSSQKKQIGTIRCNRCNYVGPVKGMWLPFRGMKPVCRQCHGEDWTTVKNP